MSGGVDRTELISTHTLRKEGDLAAVRAAMGLEPFQPTPSARRVTFTRPFWFT